MFEFKHGIVQSHANLLSTVMRAVDPLIIVLSTWLAYYLSHSSWILPTNYLWASIQAALLVAVTFPLFRIYESWRGESLENELGALLIACIAVFIILLLLSVVTKTSAQFSRLWMGYWLACSVILLSFFRLLLRFALRWLRSQGFNQRRVVIIGTGELARDVANRLLDAPWTGLNVLGFFDEAPIDVNQIIAGRPLLGGFDRIADYVKREAIDQIWLAMPWSHQKAINQVLYNLRHSTADVQMVLDVFSYRLLNMSLSEVAGLPILNLSTSPFKGINRLLKFLEDWVLALIILALMSPLMVIIAIGIKLSSPGPILFRQKRHGYDGKEVEVWKFRSMRMHQEQENKVTQASYEDPRITRFGAFLRHTSLDELPQFINVLQGHMSIVGPRPHAIVHNDHYKEQIEHYMLRHKVKPGITGWAQVNGFRGETGTLEKMQKRVEYDFYYIENWSLWFDLKIILLTFFKGFVSKNAY